MSFQRSIPSPSRLSLALVLALGLSACGGDKAEAPAAAAPPPDAAAQAAQQAAAVQQAAALAALPVEELKARGRQAYRDQRLFTPAGNNAMEYYLALRRKSDKPDPGAESALIDLQPYAVIGAEQALGRVDFLEAERIRALIAAADPQAPSLSRIADAIAKGRADQASRATDDAARTATQAADAEAARLKAAADARAAAEAARTAAATPSAPAQPAALPPPQAAPPPVQAAPEPVVQQPVPPQPRPQPAAPSRPAPSSGELVVVNAPQPVYPPEARRSRTSGEVTVSFTVNSDGSVSNVDVLSARPRGVFERNVQSAVRRWRFQPIGGSQNVTRTFTFAP